MLAERPSLVGAEYAGLGRLAPPAFRRWRRPASGLPNGSGAGAVTPGTCGRRSRGSGADRLAVQCPVWVWRSGRDLQR